MQKKAQLQIMENIFAIVIIVIILAIAFVFMVAVDRQEQRSREQDIAALDVVKKSQVLNLFEMQDDLAKRERAYSVLEDVLVR